MLNDKKTYATIPVADLARAQRFYTDLLGMHPEMITEGGVMYSSGETQFFVYPSAYRASGHTQMSWRVSDIESEVAALKAAGIVFEEFDRPGVTSRGGIYQSGPNVRTAWFKDPDGNLLGLTEIS